MLACQAQVLTKRFFFGRSDRRAAIQTVDPSYLTWDLLMPEQENETGCAKWEPARVGLELGTNENRLSDKCHVGVDRPGLASMGAGQVPDS